jgi:HSP20 family molecular chaperone IbpA
MEQQQDFLRDLNQFITGRRVTQFVPPADVLVDDEGVSVYMDVPGTRGEDLAIELENDILSIHAERPFPYQDRGDAGSSAASAASSAACACRRA